MLSFLKKINLIQYNKYLNAYIIYMYYMNGNKKIILYKNYKRKYIIGNFIYEKNKSNFNLTHIPLGTFISNIEMTMYKGGQLVRSFNSKAKIISKNKKWVTVLLPSQNLKVIYKNCLASIENKKNNEKNLFTFFFIKKKSKVRGSAMNAIDHPHGGGKGKSPIGKKRPNTPWGIKYKIKKK